MHQRQLVLPIAALLMERSVEPHTLIRLTKRKGRVELRCVDTPGARAARAVREPVALPGGERLSREEIGELVARAASEIEALKRDAHEDDLRERVMALERIRSRSRFWDDPAMAMSVLREHDRHARIIDRLERLSSWTAETLEYRDAADTKHKVEQLGKRAVRLTEALDCARRELVTMAPEGYWDAIVQVRTVGRTAALARDLLVSVYRDWAADRRMEVEWICHPTRADQPVVLAIKGHYANGYLALESGLHRVRRGETTAVASVRVGPWLDTRSEPELTEQRALKTTGVYGERVRSRLVCGNGLLIQNERSLAENRDLATELAPSWDALPPEVEDVIRRYDLEPFKLRDAMTRVTSGRRTALAPRELHQLLCARIDTGVRLPPERTL